MLRSDQRGMSTTIKGVPMPPHTRYLTKMFNVMAFKKPFAVKDFKNYFLLGIVNDIPKVTVNLS